MFEKRLILVGGGGFCRELLILAGDCHQAGSLPPVGGYLDDTGDALTQFGYDVPWLGRIEDYLPRAHDEFVLALGTPVAKRSVFEKLSMRGGFFPKLIHPTANIAPTAHLEQGVIFGFLAAAGPETSIGRFATFNNGSGIGHDGIVGEFSTLSANVDVTGRAVLGSDVTVGTKAVILPGVRIGDGATVGAGSIVYRSVPAGATVYASPAKMLKVRSKPSSTGGAQTHVAE